MTDFISRLRAQKPTRKIFRLPFSLEENTDMLREAVRNDVLYNGGAFRDDSGEYIAQAARWLTDAPTPGLIIFGGVGNGKTTLLNAIADTVNILNLRANGEQQAAWVWKIDTDALVRIARQDESELRKWIERPMLALDDLGAEEAAVKSYGNLLNPVVDLIMYRYKMRLFTIMTSNLSPKNIRERYGDRVADRMNEIMTRITIKHQTYRERRDNADMKEMK